jgi:hemoglobin
MKKDITNPEDIALLVDSFYAQVRNHSDLNYIFDTVAKVDWPSHLPKMYAFWGNLLLGTPMYEGNVMQKHLALHQTYALQQEHFDAWLALFTETVATHFEGPVAQQALTRARTIIEVMAARIRMM